MEINKIYCMDNVLGMSQMGDESVDLCVTSPPYDKLRSYNGFYFDFEGVAKNLFRIIKRGGVVVWVVGDSTINGSETGSSFRQALYFMEIGFRLHDTMIYAKDGISFPDSVRYQQCFEYMFVFAKGKPKTINLISDRRNKSFGQTIHGTDRNPDGTTKRVSGYGNKIKEFGVRWNIWSMVSDKGFNTKHPAPFPESLARDHILSWSKPGDLVLDPFMGSGTTAKMALSTGRNYIGFEISQEYVDIANERLKIYTA